MGSTTPSPSPRTSGGYDDQGERWEHLQYLPYELLRRKWQWHLLTMLRQRLKTEAINQLVDACFTKYPNGLVTTCKRGKSLGVSERGGLRGQIRREPPDRCPGAFDRYDGERVTYHYRSHRTDRWSTKPSLSPRFMAG